MTVKPIILIAVLALLLSGTSSAQPTQLKIDRDSNSMRLGITGEPGRDYILEAASDNLGTNNWELVLTATLTNSLFGWFDAASSVMPQRFYRALQLNEPAPPAVAADFRLIDHLGKSRALNYHLSDPNVQSIVLIFTGNGCAKVREMIPAINSLREQFSAQGVLFWMIDSSPSDNRSNIVVEANTQGIDVPILHDPAQVVAREYGATSTLEAFALKKVIETWTTNWVVFYRGALDDRPGPAPVNHTQFYLSSALTAFLSGQPVTISRTRPEGCAIPFNPPQLVVKLLQRLRRHHLADDLSGRRYPKQDEPSDPVQHGTDCSHPFGALAGRLLELDSFGFTALNEIGQFLGIHSAFPGPIIRSRYGHSSADPISPSGPTRNFAARMPRSRTGIKTRRPP